MFYDDNLHQLQEKLARKKHLQAKMKALRGQSEQLERRVVELEAVRQKENRDVELLEKDGLAAFFLRLAGKKLDQEQADAYAARLKYDAAWSELQAVKQDIRSVRTELDALSDIEAWYASALKKKAKGLKESGGPLAQDILGLEEDITYLESEKKELREAVKAGNQALSTAKSVMNSLNSAEDYSTWDMLGGGLLADIAKHDKLDNAQSQIRRLQSQLRSFQTELADVTIQADLEVTIGGFMHFADFFFDGLFADMAVRDEIHNSQIRMRKTISEIDSVLYQLTAREKAVDDLIHAKNTGLEELLVNAER